MKAFQQWVKPNVAIERCQELTPREWEVLELMVAGMKNRFIAQELGISTKTLDIHRANITRKLKVRPVAYWTVYCPARLAEAEGKATFKREHDEPWRVRMAARAKR